MKLNYLKLLGAVLTVVWSSALYAATCPTPTNIADLSYSYVNFYAGVMAGSSSTLSFTIQPKFSFQAASGTICLDTHSQFKSPLTITANQPYTPSEPPITLWAYQSNVPITGTLSVTYEVKLAGEGEAGLFATVPLSISNGALAPVTKLNSNNIVACLLQTKSTGMQTISIQCTSYKTYLSDLRQGIVH